MSARSRRKVKATPVVSPAHPSPSNVEPSAISSSSTGFVSRLPLSVHLLLAVAFRLAVFGWTSAPEVLMDRLELTTPLTGFRRCESDSRERWSRRMVTVSSPRSSVGDGPVCNSTVREGVFLQSKGLDPYHGGTFNHVSFRFFPSWRDVVR